MECYCDCIQILFYSPSNQLRAAIPEPERFRVVLLSDKCTFTYRYVKTLCLYLSRKSTAGNGDSITVVLFEWVRHMLCAFLELIGDRCRVYPANCLDNKCGGIPIQQMTCNGRTYYTLLYQMVTIAEVA